MFPKNSMLSIMSLLLMGMQSAAIDYPKVNVDELKDSQVSTVSTTARQAQLSFLRFGSPKNLTQWIDYYYELMDSPAFKNMDIQAIATNSPVTPLVTVVAIGIIMAIITFLVGFCFFLWRRCDKCGGRNPKPDGYTTTSLAVHISFLVIFGAICIAFAALFWVYSGAFTTSVGTVNTGISALLGSGVEFLENTKIGISSTSEPIQVLIDENLLKLKHINLSTTIKEKFGVLVESMTSEMYSAQISIDSTRTLLDTAGMAITALKTKIDDIDSSLDSIKTSIQSMKTITVDVYLGGTMTYNVSVPDTSALTSFIPPRIDFDLTPYNSSMNGVQNLKEIADNLLIEYETSPAKAFNQINETLAGMKFDAALMTKNLTIQMNETLNGFQDKIKSLNESISKNYQSLVVPYDGYRDLTFMAESLLVIVPVVLAYIAVVIKKGYLTAPFACCATFIGFLAWIQFLIFYLISAPLAVVCDSGEYIAENDLIIPKAVNSFVESALNMEVNLETPINMAVFADNCHQGKTLYTAQLNSQGQTAKILLSSFLGEMLAQFVYPLLGDQVNITSLVKLPDLPSGLDNLRSLNFTLDLSQLNFGDIEVGLDLKVEAQKITETAHNITAISLDSDLGDVAKLDAAIATFNSEVTQINSGFPPLSRAEVFSNYIETNTVFDATPITSNTSQQQQIVRNFNVNVATRASFIHNMNISLTQYRGKADVLSTKVLDFDANVVTPIRNGASNLTNLAKSISSQLNLITIDLTDLLGYVDQYSSFKTTFPDQLMDALKTVLKGVAAELIDAIFAKNPNEEFGKCKALSESAVFLGDGVCRGFTDALSGFWFCMMILGIFLLVSFCATVRTWKRLTYLDIRRRSVSAEYKVKGDKMQEVESGIRSSVEADELPSPDGNGNDEDGDKY